MSEVYPKPCVTADIILYQMPNGRRLSDRYLAEIILIRRQVDPFKDCWALPGGHFNCEAHHDEKQDESIVAAAKRELFEELGVNLDEKSFDFVSYKDAINRDPRGRYITFAFSAKLPCEQTPSAGSDAMEYDWFYLEASDVSDVFEVYRKATDEKVELAFDHKDIIRDWILKHPIKD